MKMKNKYISTFFLVSLLFGFVAQAQESNLEILDWENPKMFNQNKEVAHATLMPYKTVDAALSKKRNESIFYRGLNGVWKFNWVRKPADRLVDFYKPAFDVTAWDVIPVPSNWEIEKRM